MNEKLYQGMNVLLKILSKVIMSKVINQLVIFVNNNTIILGCFRGINNIKEMKK